MHVMLAGHISECRARLLACGGNCSSRTARSGKLKCNAALNNPLTFDEKQALAASLLMHALAASHSAPEQHPGSAPPGHRGRGSLATAAGATAARTPPVGPAGPGSQAGRMALQGSPPALVAGAAVESRQGRCACRKSRVPALEQPAWRNQPAAAAVTARTL